VSSSRNLWTAYQLAKEWRERPSVLYDIDDPVDAFRFDRAVHIFGSALQAELEAVEGKTKQVRATKQRQILQKWIPEATGTKQEAKKYRDPASRSSK
jgi:hypothetical protein